MSAAFLTPTFYSSVRDPSSNLSSCRKKCPLLVNHSKPSWGISMMEKLPNSGVNAPQGFKAAGYTAGFKQSGQPDLALVVTEDFRPVPTAAVFTTNLVRAAPIIISEAHLQESASHISAILLNAGQANAATGDIGLSDAMESAVSLSNILDVPTHNIFICSTGVIGRRIDMDKMTDAIPHVVAEASASNKDGTSAAVAITTTDLRHKEIAFTEVINGKKVTVGGMCKGSGMIHPSMATMLAVITCDAKIDPDLWQYMLKRAVDKSFNAITVDGDTSTNDVVCALASGKSGLNVTSVEHESGKKLEELLTATCQHLAKTVARDGEGATVLIEIEVKGADSNEDAGRIAKTVASSSLVKSAVFGRDPNWGRIAAAAGRSGSSFDQQSLKICIGGHVLMENGTPIEFDEEAASQYMKDKANASEDEYLSDKDTVVISLEVGNGPGVATAWGCDLSYKYVEINAEYTT